jgi:multiple sugar transport system ATP-binding protein
MPRRWMGAPVVTEDVVEGVVEDEEEHEIAPGLREATNGDRTTFVGRLDPSSRVRPDDEIELVVDTERLQFFDLETGHAIHESAV